MSGDQVVILTASMSGTADMVADEVAEKLESLGFDCKVAGMQKASATMLEKRSVYIICTSTYGSGDVPDNGQAFYELLLNERPDLSHVLFGVIGLGDMTYFATFCGAGIKFDDILDELGATRLVPRMEHDSKSAVHPEDMALQWLDGWVESYRKTQSSADQKVSA